MFSTALRILSEPQNLLFDTEMSQAAEFRFFAEFVIFLKIHFRTGVLFSSLIPATFLRCNQQFTG